MTGVEFSKTSCTLADGASDGSDAFALQLRTGGLFIILVASAAGAYLPLLIRHGRLPRFFLFGQAFAGASFDLASPSLFRACHWDRC